jgi:hypothetical protein
MSTFYRPKLDVSLSSEDESKLFVCYILSENLTQFDFGEFPHHPLDMKKPTILNDPHQ